MTSVPNFLFIITDQQRADHLGCYGNAVLRTPHIDRLAARGARFDRFYVASPACMPNRASIMTGRMPSVHGARGNGVPLSLDEVTYPELLGAGGYRTALIGKSHLQNMNDTPAVALPEVHVELQVMEGLDESRRRSVRGSEYQQERRGNWKNPEHSLTLPYYGFQHVELCNHHGDLTFGDWQRWAAAQDPAFQQACGYDNAWPTPPMGDIQAWRTRLPEGLYSSAYIGDRACAYLERHADETAGTPFFLQCAFPDPHHPFTPPGGYWDMYSPDDVILPETCRPPGPDAPPHVRRIHEKRWAAGADSNRSKRFSTSLSAVTPDEARRAIALTYGMISMIDDVVGRLVHTLERTGLARDTVIIFTSDHGDLMGDHGLIYKGPAHYQGLIRVPFIWSDPQFQQPVVHGKLGSSVDIARTILTRAGIAPCNGMQGRDMLEQGSENAIPSRDAVIVEEENQRDYLGLDGPNSARTLITQRWRLSLYADVDWGELYDLENDPLETRNLWLDTQAADIRARLMEQLARRMIENRDHSPAPTSTA